AYRGGTAAWIAGRGGAILRRTEQVATIEIPRPKLPPILRGAPKLKNPDDADAPPILDDGDIPRAVPPKNGDSPQH
nr:hypothetical protein [Pyrinomonadaceae bacterium]